MGEGEALGESRNAHSSVRKILYRNEETEVIRNSINSFYTVGKSDNLFIVGKSGSGKTSTLRQLMSEIGSTKHVVYVDCYENSTKNAIFSILAANLGNVFVSKGFASYEIFGRISEIITKENQKVVLILDHFEALSSKTTSELICPLIGLNETLGDHFQIIIATSDSFMLQDLSPKITSSLLFKLLKFEPYTREEITEIIRLKSTLPYEPSIIEKIVEIAVFSDSDIRLALNILHESERNAKQRGSIQTQFSDFALVYEKLVSLNQEQNNLSEEERLIMNILKIGEQQSADIYSMFLKRAKRSKRQIRNYLASLVEKGIIEFSELKTDSPLKPKIYRLKREGNNGTDK